MKGATRNLIKNALLDIAKDFGIKMTDKVMNKIASDFVSNLLHVTRLHLKRMPKVNRSITHIQLMENLQVGLGLVVLLPITLMTVLRENC